MKKLLSFIALAVLSILTANAQDITGTWNGEIQYAQQKLKIVFHIDKDKQGKAICTMDSPTQGVNGIETAINHISDDSLAISVAKIGMTFKGKKTAISIKGTLSQNGIEFPLELIQGEMMVLRLQNPMPPFPYKTEEVVFENTADSATLSGTISYPIGHKEEYKVPIVLLVTGSGLQNRDEELLGHKPFLVLADYLAQHGIATLRYDDRGCGKSKGNVKNATTEDFARDAFAGLKYLRATGKFSSIGILGHSEGASIAFMAGSGQFTDFIISLAGVTVKGAVNLAEQVNLISGQSGIPSNVTPEQYIQMAEQSGNSWLIYFSKYDPSEDIKACKCPVFALNGDKDVQVISRINLPALQKILPSNPKNRIKEYEGMNHLFQKCSSGNPSEYFDIITTIEPSVLRDITEWIASISVK